MRRPRGDGAGISIVCVFNDPEVRAACLDRSIERYPESDLVEYHPVDNTGHTFTTAGAALNHGARQCTKDVVVFVHQDVYLHSLDRIIDAAGHLGSGVWGMLGAAGVRHSGGVVGRMRDRLLLEGSDAPQPTEVDSLDEVFFMVNRDQVLEHPLSEDNELAWHAYAVEYGLRLRSQGMLSGALNLGITHNSLTVNLANLDVAHRHLAEMYAAATPVRTTCGVISSGGPQVKDVPLLRGQRWRYRRYRESVAVRRAQKRFPAPTVLRDIRVDVDSLDFSAAEPLHVINVDSVGGFARYADESLVLPRRGKRFLARTCGDLNGLRASLEALQLTDSVLVTNLSFDDLSEIGASRLVEPDKALLGVHDRTAWLLCGPVLETLPEDWRSPRAVPMSLASVPFLGA